MKERIMEALNDGKYEEASRLLYLMGLNEAYSNAKNDKLDKYLVCLREMASDGWINAGVAEIMTAIEFRLKNNNRG